MEEEWKRQR